MWVKLMNVAVTSFSVSPICRKFLVNKGFYKDVREIFHLHVEKIKS